MSENKKRLFLLDAYALIYRSYFAFIKNPRFNSKGLNTSAMFGFVNTLEQLLKNERPSHIAVVFDMHAPTFRHEMFKEYKANREEMPEDLRKSIPYIRQIVEAYNIPILEKEGFEADDVIGTLAKMAETKGYETFMVTPDKDYAQLVSENIFMYKPARGGNETEIWGPEQVKENFMVENPEQVIDILGLMGDTADNIPGCPGIGPKTAMKLITDFGSIDNLYKNIDQLKGKQKENLETYEEQVLMSKKLAKIILDVPLSFDEKALATSDPDNQKLKNIFTELDFRAFVGRIQESAQPAPVFEQGTLFGASLEPVVAEENKFDTIETILHDYYLIETPEQRASLCAELSVQDEFCFDTETTSLDTQLAELVCLSFSFRNHEAYCVPVPKEKEEALSVLKEFELVFGDERILKIGQNLKYDISVLMNYGIEVKGPLYDTMIAHYLIQPELRHNLDHLCEQYLGYQKVKTESLIGKKGKSQMSMRQVAVEKLRDYACEDADLTLQLKKAIDPELDKHQVRKLF